jgi:hypothetical protein
MKSYLSGRAGCLYRQAAGSWNVLDTLSDVIICNHLSATRRFCYVPEPSMGFHEVLWDSMRFRGILWGSMRFYDVPVNRSVPIEANRGLTSYTFSGSNTEIYWVVTAQSSAVSSVDLIQAGALASLLLWLRAYASAPIVLLM